MKTARWSWLVLLVALMIGTGCRNSPTDPDTATVTFDLHFPPDSSDAVPDITGVRIFTVDAATDAVLVTHELSIIEGVNARMIALSIRDNLGRLIMFEMDLLTGEEADVVTWRGRTGTFLLEAGADERAVVTFSPVPVTD